jgi:AraC-like DNA-binding protein
MYTTLQFNILELFQLIAAAIGLFLAALIWHKYHAILANRLLSLFLFLYSLVVLHNLAFELGAYRLPPQYILVSIGIIYVVSPWLYLYGRYLIAPHQTFAWKNILHFLPFLVFELSLLPFFIHPDRAGALQIHPGAENMPPLFLLYNTLLLLQAGFYMILILRLIRNFHHDLKEVTASIEKVKLNWLLSITLMLATAWLVFFIENLLLIFGINLSNFSLSTALMALYVIALGYQGMLKSDQFAASRAVRAVEEMSTKSVAGGGRYEKSGLDPARAGELLNELLRLMEADKVYTDNELTLGELAARLAVSPHNLSEILSTQVGKNFYDFVNGYRVVQVKRDLADPAMQHLKILAIAFDAGFNSKAAFNTIFRAATGETPSAWREKALTSR